MKWAIVTSMIINVSHMEGGKKMRTRTAFNYKYFTCILISGALALSMDACAANPPTAPVIGVSSPGDKAILTTRFGAKADGSTDDTEKLQQALTYCSVNNLVCQIPDQGRHLVKHPLFLWGHASLIGAPGGSILFDSDSDSDSERYLLNLGISGKRNIVNPTGNLKAPFSGLISKINFVLLKGAPSGGRVIYFWRTDGGTIDGNRFDLKAFAYSATASGNVNDWVVNGEINCIRKNLTITNNTVLATATSFGGEGIALDHFDSATISNNSVSGVGDDPIAVHLSQNIKILNNIAESVDGRIFVSNSKDVEIAYNKHSRIPSPLNGEFYQGIGLIYIGFENYEISTNNLTPYPSPENINVHDNQLFYPKGAIDGNGSAIYVYAPRNVTIENNVITNDSAGPNPLNGIYVLPISIPRWKDPTGIDKTVDEHGVAVARVHDAHINANQSVGAYPLPLTMSGNCVDYVGNLKITNNFGGAKFNFYCQGSGVYLMNNKTTER